MSTGGGAAPARIAYRQNPFFTPRLNALFEVMMRDRGRPDAHCVWAWLNRYSWGNWCQYACEKPPRLAAKRNFNPATEPGLEVSIDPSSIAALGVVPCPLCKRTRISQDGVPDDFPWHLHCRLWVYAIDAVACGTKDEIAWAGWAIRQEKMPVPVLREWS